MEDDNSQFTKNNKTFRLSKTPIDQKREQNTNKVVKKPLLRRALIENPHKHDIDYLTSIRNRKMKEPLRTKLPKHIEEYQQSTMVRNT